MILVAIFATSIFLPASPFYEVRVCLFYHLTGFSCPGCGLGRSFCALSHGDVGGAFSAHWLGPLIYVLFLFVLVRTVSELVIRRQFPRLLQRRARCWLGTFAVVAIFAVWIVRLIGEIST